jgi:hypothetical protein
MDLTPDLVSPSVTRNSGIIGEGVDLSLAHLDDIREFHARLSGDEAAAVYEVG